MAIREFLEHMGANVSVRGSDKNLRDGLQVLKNLYEEYEIKRDREAAE